MSKKKKFQVEITTEGSIFLTVEAESADQAKEIAWELAEQNLSLHSWEYVNALVDEIKE